MVFAKMASSAETYCLCGQPYNIGQFMIECDCCREWFHGSCVNVKVYQSEDIDKYHCPKCVSTYGPSIYRVPTNDHRQDRYEVNADRKPTQTGSKAFISNLAARKFPFQFVVVLQGTHFTETYLKEQGFNTPLLFETTVGLELRVPPSNTFSVRTVARHCGSSREIDVIDVTRQTNFKMSLGDFVDYFTSLPEERGDKILNVLSLEFTDTPMAALVWPPLMARQLDWVRVVWPPEAPPFSPMVQRYCIMSPAQSYTDFHLDFGGTTVWYHVLHGQKIFYLIPPTNLNLTLYQQWSTSTNQSEVFFGDMVDSCSMCILKRGQTLFIPTGWIHAVLTPEDSLVFGGNFLHSLNIELQLQVYEIEKQIDTPSIFRFPQFETIHWYAGAHLLQQLRRINEEQQDKDFTLKDGVKDNQLEVQRKAALDLPPYLVRGVRILAAALKEWNACKNYDQSKKDAIPDTINSSLLVRELSRELRQLEKLLPQSSLPPHVSPPKKKKKRPKAQEPKMPKVHSQPPPDRHFAAVSNQKTLPSMPLNYDPVNPRTLYSQHSQAAGGHHQVPSGQPGRKSSIKLTLPKPIMHVQDSNQMFSNSSQDSDDAELNNIANIASHSGLATFSQGYDSQDSFGAENDYRVPGDHVNVKKNPNPYTELTSNERGGAVLKIKLGSPPSTSMGSPQQHANQRPPPDYATTEHSILKSHLIGNSSNIQRQQKPSNQWTISKSHVKNTINDTTDEQILFTNENLTMPGTSHTTNVASYANASIPYDSNGMIYGPGMYGNDNIVQTQQVVTTTENYDPEFVIDRKNGMGLPDYSPTKSMNEFLGQPKPPLYMPHTPRVDNAKPSYSTMTTATPMNFANHSDPYSQGVRAQDGASPFSDDSSVLTGTDGYSMIQDDPKSAGMVQGKMTVLQTADFHGNRDEQIYEYVDSKGQVYKTTENLMYKTEQVVYKTEQSVYKLEQQQSPVVYKDSRGNTVRQNVIQQHSDQQILGQNVVVYNQDNQINQMNTPAVPPPAYSAHTTTTPAVRRTDRPSRRRVEPRASSIYDYYEDPDDGDALYIDETPTTPQSGHKGKRKTKDKSIKITIPAHVFRQESAGSGGGGRNASNPFSAPKNGIESLLQASEYTGSNDNQERDAVAGMLSIGQSYGLARAEPTTTRRSIPATEAPPIRAVHRDDEYVYPSLDMSSDEEDDMPPSRRTPNSKSKRKTPYTTPSADRSDREDESWSPRGRLGRLLPRLNRPTRRGSRREAVQAALRAARLRGTHHDDNAQMAPVSLQSSPMLLSGGVPPSPAPAPHPAATPTTSHLQTTHTQNQMHTHSSGSVTTPSASSNNLMNNSVTPLVISDKGPPLTSISAPLPVKTVTVATTPLIKPANVRQTKEPTNVVKKPSRKKRPAKPLRPAPPVQHVLPSPVAPKVQKFKKGMKTAKQRLGKILKIHKMMC